MKKVTFITGNEGKVKYLEKYFDVEIPHYNADVEEIQSLDLQEIVSHKLEQAFGQVEGPVLVEDTSVEFLVMGRLPGPLIKWFLEDLSLQDICDLLHNKNRDAKVRCMFGYYDGNKKYYFEGVLAGEIATQPIYGEHGFGWDPIFIPQGYNTSRAGLDEKSYETTYRLMRPIDELKKFLE